MITRIALRGREVEALGVEVDRCRFGFLVPFFFVTSGINFDLDCSSSAGALLKVPLFLALFLIVRGRRLCCSYRGVLDAGGAGGACVLRHRVATRGGDHDGGAGRRTHMRSSTAAALVGAAILSTLIFPLVGLSLRKSATSRPVASKAAAGGG